MWRQTVIQKSRVETMHREGETIASIVCSARQTEYAYRAGQQGILMPDSNKIGLI
jgi:hypothetical protein